MKMLMPMQMDFSEKLLALAGRSYKMFNIIMQQYKPSCLPFTITVMYVGSIIMLSIMVDASL